MSCDESDFQFVDVYRGNDHTLDLNDVASNSTAINDATVTYQIYDMEDDSAVSGASGTIAISGTGGDYTGEVDKSIIDLLTIGHEYRIQVDGLVSGTYDFQFNEYIRVRRRGRT